MSCHVCDASCGRSAPQSSRQHDRQYVQSDGLTPVLPTGQYQSLMIHFCASASSGPMDHHRAKPTNNGIVSLICKSLLDSRLQRHCWNVLAQVLLWKASHYVYIQATVVVSKVTDRPNIPMQYEISGTF